MTGGQAITMTARTHFRVRALLQERGLTATWLMRETKLSWPVIQAITSDDIDANPRTATLERIADALGVRVVDLFAEVTGGS